MGGVEVLGGDRFVWCGIDVGRLFIAEPEADPEDTSGEDGEPDRPADLVRRRIVTPLVDRADLNESGDRPRDRTEQKPRYVAADAPGPSRRCGDPRRRRYG